MNWYRHPCNTANFKAVGLFIDIVVVAMSALQP